MDCVFFLVLVYDYGFYWFGIFGVEIEDVVYFDFVCFDLVVCWDGIECCFVMFFFCCCIILCVFVYFGFKSG